MIVYIKNKFSLAGGSSVLDERQNPVFNVKGKVFSITRKKTLCDAEGNRLFVIRNKFVNWFVHRAYIFDKDGNRVATVKDKWLNLNKEYFITGTKDEYKIEGKFFSPTAYILRNGLAAGIIRRQFAVVMDAFELEAAPEDIPFMIALVIALDNIVDKKT